MVLLRSLSLWSGDVPVVDHPPPGSTRFVVTRVLQRLRPCS